MFEFWKNHVFEHNCTLRTKPLIWLIRGRLSKEFKGEPMRQNKPSYFKLSSEVLSNVHKDFHSVSDTDSLIFSLNSSVVQWRWLMRCCERKTALQTRHSIGGIVSLVVVSLNSSDYLNSTGWACTVLTAHLLL